jgi:hypothetical protein
VRDARGRRPATVEYEVLRELGDSDIALANGEAGLGTPIPAIQRLRHAHHQLARVLASGVKAVEASYITGYTQSRISILKADPAFQELLAYYAEQREAQYLDVHQRLAVLGTSTAEELQERIDEQPEKFTNRELMELIELTLPTQKAGAKAQASGAPALPPVVNIQFVSAPPAPPQSSPALEHSEPPTIDSTLLDLDPPEPSR